MCYNWLTYNTCTSKGFSFLLVFEKIIFEVSYIMNTNLSGTVTPTTHPDHVSSRKSPGPVASKPQSGKLPPGLPPDTSALPPHTGSVASSAATQNGDSASAAKEFDVAKLSIKVHILYLITRSVDFFFK